MNKNIMIVLALISVGILFAGCTDMSLSTDIDSTESASKYSSTNNSHEVNNSTHDNVYSETIEQQSNSDDSNIILPLIEVLSVSGDRLTLPNDFNINVSSFGDALNTIHYDNMTYVLKSLGDTYTSEKNPEIFLDSQHTEIVKCTEYRAIYLNESIDDWVADKTLYSHCISLSPNYEMSYEYPDFAELRLNGKITLTGIIAQAQTPEDYGYAIYGNTMIFLPYGSSLQSSSFPALHSEIINAQYMLDNDEFFTFYGETIPFEIDFDTELEIKLGEKKYHEIEITFSSVEQTWYYNGSGYNLCTAEIEDYIFL